MLFLRFFISLSEEFWTLFSKVVRGCKKNPKKQKEKMETGGLLLKIRHPYYLVNETIFISIICSTFLISSKILLKKNSFFLLYPSFSLFFLSFHFFVLAHLNETLRVKWRRVHLKTHTHTDYSSVLYFAHCRYSASKINTMIFFPLASIQISQKYNCHENNCIF